MPRSAELLILRVHIKHTGQTSMLTVWLNAITACCFDL